MSALTVLHLDLRQPVVLPHQPLADDAEDEPRRVVNLAVEACGPAEVDVLAGVAVGIEAGWVGSGSRSEVCEMVLKRLNVRVERGESREEVVDGGDGKLTRGAFRCSRRNIVSKFTRIRKRRKTIDARQLISAHQRRHAESHR